MTSAETSAYMNGRNIVSATRVESAELESALEAIALPDPALHKGGNAQTTLLRVAVALMLAAAVAVAIVVPLSLDDNDDLGYDEAEPVMLLPFDSCGKLSSKLRLWPGYDGGSEVSLSERYSQYGGDGFVVFAAAEYADASASARSGSGDSSGAAASDYSTTSEHTTVLGPDAPTAAAAPRHKTSPQPQVAPPRRSS